MSKINAIRLINLNYNNNAIRISDETFSLGGESTLFSLRNGGGKSVLAQMIMAPFVHKHYRNAKDRPFASYFTSAKPTFILVEWKLDQGAGYVLTGMMVRKSQEISEERADDLEVVQFIAEYKGHCEQDIHRLPVVEKTKKNVTLKGFHACKQLFETYKRERSIPFFSYDMSSPAQSRQYFEKLAEYQIHYKEWETIIKKVNLRESGLSDLFADCRDERGLLEKWFLDTVENKLNRDRNRMREFQNISEKYIGQYKDNQSKIERRDRIRAFEQEAERIQSGAIAYRDAAGQAARQESRIADFLSKLHRACEQEKQNAALADERVVRLTEQLKYLEYEKISKEIHRIADEERFCGSNLDMLKIERDDLNYGREKIAQTLHRLICAKQREEAVECEEDAKLEQERFLLCKKKEEDLEPERNRLGAQLKQYYTALLAAKERERKDCVKLIDNMELRQSEEEIKLEELREQDKKYSERAGALGAKVRQFDDMEGKFNRTYSESFCRNILGEYEPGELQIRQSEYEKEKSSTEHEKADLKKEIEQYKAQAKSLQRKTEDEMADQIRLESKQRENAAQIASFEAELAERRVILHYYNIKEEDLFDTEKILSQAEQKLAETERMRRGLEKEWDEADKSYRRLAQGRVLELSDEFLNLLSEAGIQFVYGMEWLGKNRYTAEKNRELVTRHPFLPYSLILSRRELKRLSSLDERIYTSSPVPIIVREELEGGGRLQKEGAVRSFSGFSFYVWFNDNLLDEEKLKNMLDEKADRIRKLDAAILRRKQEYAEYIEKREKIRNQKVSGRDYEAAKEARENLNQRFMASEQGLLRMREELETLENSRIRKEQVFAKKEQELSYQNRRISDFSEFMDGYEVYQENRRLLEKNKKEKERVLNLQKLTFEKIQKLRQELVTAQNMRSLLERAVEDCEKKQMRFLQYAADADVISGKKNEYSGSGSEAAQAENERNSGGVLTGFDVQEAEARYDAITGGIGAEQKELELRVFAAQKRLAKAQEEYNRLLDKYGLSGGETDGVRYSRKEEAHQEVLLEDQDRKIAQKERMIHEQEIQCALLKQQREAKYAQMRERCEQEEPVKKAEIQTIDYADAMKKIEYERNEAKEEQKQILTKIQGMETNLTALAEYEDFICREQIEWEFDVSVLTGAQLTKQKGILIRDYHFYLEQKRQMRSGLERVLNEIVRAEEFSENFYRKPIEAMLLLTDDAELVLRQLNVTLISYRSLMEKLLVDISLVEKEKEKIVELIGDYLKEVHENLNRIDRNSTITIRERPVKMLKLELPDWEENEPFYRQRLFDELDDITARGIAMLEENQPVLEYLGTKLTTKSLYDAVVGIGNVRIRLYKIEEAREYPITWADVARNSGGEGFLSAFVILSALLYYIRKDETDIFADRNEGKVLLMDNPFAQTNAAHLLKPLMDMAKKTNTQLICLSGLGGDSIYNRFDNIYVLTLIAANLRNDMQYLKAEHMRGSQEETVLAAQIEVMEQQELVF